MRRPGEDVGFSFPEANIVVSAPKEVSQGRGDWRYMQIGEQFFHTFGEDEVSQGNTLQGLFSAPTSAPATTTKYIRSLPSPTPASPASQNPTITLYNPVRLIPSLNHSLPAFLDSLVDPTTSGLQCPVPWCEEAVVDFEGHLRSHAQTAGAEAESSVTKDKELVSVSKESGKKRRFGLSRVATWLGLSGCLLRYRSSRSYNNLR